MKRTMMFLAFGAALPFCTILAEEPAAENKPAVAHPIEITQGYGSAKWGMSVEDFQEAYPQAKPEQDVPEDIWRKTMAFRSFTLEDESKKLSFMFARGTLLRVTLSLEEHFPNDYRQGDSWSRSICADINRQFSFAKDSGVTVKTQISDTNFPGSVGGRPSAGPAMPRRMIRTAPVPAHSEPNSPAPAIADQPKLPPLIPPPLTPPTYAVMVTLEQHKLGESISAEFKRLTDAAQEKATQQVISKLAPPM